MVFASWFFSFFWVLSGICAAFLSEIRPFPPFCCFRLVFLISFCPMNFVLRYVCFSSRYFNSLIFILWSLFSALILCPFSLPFYSLPLILCSLSFDFYSLPFFSALFLCPSSFDFYSLLFFSDLFILCPSSFGPYPLTFTISKKLSINGKTGDFCKNS